MVQVAEQLGVEKLVLDRVDYDYALDPQYGGVVDMTRVPVK